VSQLTQFGPGLWIAEGDTVSVAGFHYPTRMALVRLRDGGLWVWSPVALTPSLAAEVRALGDVHHLVAPNSLHYLHIGDWAGAFPLARVHTAPGIRTRRPDFAFQTELDDTPDCAWAGDIDQVIVRGNRITTEVVFHHRASGTALFTDLIQQFPPTWFKGWRGLVARLDGMVRAAPAVPMKFRLAFTDRAAARSAIARIQAWGIDQLIMAHGAPVSSDGQAVVVAAFRWLRVPPA
jgi:hypothetical protein